jgi:hypothetical protein
MAYFIPENEIVKGVYRKLHNEELLHMQCLPDIVREIKSGRIKWAGNIL